MSSVFGVRTVSTTIAQARRMRTILDLKNAATATEHSLEVVNATESIESRERLFACYPLTFLVAHDDFDGRFDRDCGRSLARRQ